MTYKQAEKHEFNPFDLTKTWSQKEFPLIEVGRMTLDRNPKNYFAEVEQIAFAPSHLVPGIEPSPDKMLQGRLFSYADTHRHRLGANYLQLPVNCPYRTRVGNNQRDGPWQLPRRTRVGNYQRDGPMAFHNQVGAPNYYPNSFSGPRDCPRHLDHREHFTGDVARFNSADEDNFTQPAVFYRQVLDEAGRERLASNIAGHLVAAQESLQQRAVANFAMVDKRLGCRLQQLLKDKSLRSRL